MFLFMFRFGGRFQHPHGGIITTLGRSRDTIGCPHGKKSQSIFTIPWTVFTFKNFRWVMFISRSLRDTFYCFYRMVSGQKRTKLSDSCYINSKFPKCYTIVTTVDWLNQRLTIDFIQTLFSSTLLYPCWEQASLLAWRQISGGIIISEPVYCKDQRSLQRLGLASVSLAFSLCQSHFLNHFYPYSNVT